MAGDGVTPLGGARCAPAPTPDPASSTNAPSAKPATSISAAARTATSSPAASAQAGPAPTATNPSPKPTSPDLTAPRRPQCHTPEPTPLVAATGQIPWPPAGSFHDRHWAVPTVP